MPIAIIGDRRSGKTVLTTLLFKTALRETAFSDGFLTFPNEEFREQYFQWTNSMELGVVVDTNLKGKKKIKYSGWPDPTLDQSAFYFAIEWKRTTINDFQIISIYDTAGESIEEFMKFTKTSKWLTKNDTKALQTYFGDKRDQETYLMNLLNAHIIIFVIDCSRLGAREGEPGYMERKKYDEDLSRIIQTVTVYKNNNEQMRRFFKNKPIFFPIIVFTKYDILNDKEIVFKRAGLNKNMELYKADEKTRKKYGEALLKSNFNVAYSLMKGSKIGRVDYKADYFFCSVETRPLTEDMKNAIRDLPEQILTKLEDKKIPSKTEYIDSEGAEQDDVNYSYEEFQKLINNTLRGIIHKLPPRLRKEELGQSDKIGLKRDLIRGLH